MCTNCENLPSKPDLICTDHLWRILEVQAEISTQKAHFHLFCGKIN